MQKPILLYQTIDSNINVEVTYIDETFWLTQKAIAQLFGVDTRTVNEHLLNILKSEEFLYGFGLGLNLETGLGVLRVSYALGKGDTFSDGKIHFGILNEF